MDSYEQRLTARQNEARRDSALRDGIAAILNASRPTAKCPECGRVFDLTDPTDANEWAYGHDCEA